MESTNKRIAQKAEQEAFGAAQKRVDALRSRAQQARYLSEAGQQLFPRASKALKVLMESTNKRIAQKAEQEAFGAAQKRVDALRSRAQQARYLSEAGQQLFPRASAALKVLMESGVKATVAKAEVAAAKEVHERNEKNGASGKTGGSNGARALGGKGGGVRAGAGAIKGGSAIKSLTQQTAEAEGLRWGFCGCTIPLRGAVTATTKPALLELPCAAEYQKRNQCGYCKKDFKSKLPA